MRDLTKRILASAKSLQDEVDALVMEPKPFVPGTQILYMPLHARGDVHHADVEAGFVTLASPDGKHVFCRYWSNSHDGLRTTLNSEATPRERLVVRQTRPQSDVDQLLIVLGYTEQNKKERPMKEIELTRDLTHRDELNDVYRQLRQLPDQINDAAMNLAIAEESLRKAKADEAKAEEDLRQAIALATMTAYQEGHIDGKNQGQRDTQIELYLAKDDAVAKTRGTLDFRHQDRMKCEATAEKHKAIHATHLHTLRALQYAVQLQVACLQLVEGTLLEMEAPNE